MQWLVWLVWLPACLCCSGADVPLRSAHPAELGQNEQFARSIGTSTHFRGAALTAVGFAVVYIMNRICTAGEDQIFFARVIEAEGVSLCLQLGSCPHVDLPKSGI